MAVPKEKQLTKKPTGWYIGCGCGSKPGDLVTPPSGSVDGLVRKRETWTSPTTFIVYNFEPGLVAIDIDERDVAVLKDGGYVSDVPTAQGFKGYLARKG